jgi:hypothetical protein
MIDLHKIIDLFILIAMSIIIVYLIKSLFEKQ